MTILERMQRHLRNANQRTSISKKKKDPPQSLSSSFSSMISIDSDDANSIASSAITSGSSTETSKQARSLKSSGNTTGDAAGTTEQESSGLKTASAATAMASRMFRRPGTRAWYCESKFDDIVARKQAEYADGRQSRVSDGGCSTSIGGNSSYADMQIDRTLSECKVPARPPSFSSGERPVLSQNSSETSSNEKEGHLNTETQSRAFVPRPLGGNLTDPETIVELCPGVYARLRGATETWNCVENDFYVPVVCFACSEEILCIQDAAYVLCPTCQIVSPLKECSGETALLTVSPVVDGGVGLGFTYDDLFKWQAQILQQRNQENSTQRAKTTQQLNTVQTC